MNAKEFMQDVYDNVSRNEPDVQAAEKAIGEEICRVTDEHKDKFSEEDLDIARDMLFTVQTMSMREGYILGAKHAATLFAAVNPKESQ